MLSRSLFVPLVPLVLSTVLGQVLAQRPVYRLDAAASPRGTINGLFQGRPGQPFVIWLDLEGGPRSLLGEAFYLGFGRAVQLLDAGALDAQGARRISLNARVGDFGSPTRSVDPNLSLVARTGDNALPDYQFEFARVKTTATSPFLKSPGATHDYHSPIVAASVPAGTSYALEYRGAMDAAGSGATQWSSSIDQADGLPFVQLRITFTGNAATREVPSLDTLIIPID